jgi:DNA-binding response OmpR family regulator
MLVFAPVGNLRADRMTARILIVEDEMLVAMELEAILEELGHEVVGIAAEAAGTWPLLRHRPTLALVDLNLRDGFTGPKIADALVREHGVPVLFMTANPRLLGEGLAGFVGVISKPCDAALVQSAVEYALRRSQGDAAIPPPSNLRAFPDRLTG